MFYRKKPVVIEARQFTGTDENIIALTEWIDDTDLSTIHGAAISHLKSEIDKHNGLPIKTLEGVMIASKGDYIIKGVQGEFYPCKPDIFDATYEPVLEN